ncbi:hypothetical protein KYY02_01750 [Streptomyces pimonensis]|uniref:Serine/threonine protein kinase n=1 Tax=Streptomyces pimonensis TaxID=2860288 RepID=A0ABV4IS36_9ACTN
MRDRPSDDSDGTLVSFTDPSGMVRIETDRDLRSEDEDIEASASEEAFSHWNELKDGEYGWGIASAPALGGQPRETTYKDREAATNTIVCTTTATPPVVHEAQVTYYRNEDGDMYRLRVVYPGKGHFAEDGREIARTVLGSWDVHEL